MVACCCCISRKKVDNETEGTEPLLTEEDKTKALERTDEPPIDLVHVEPEPVDDVNSPVDLVNVATDGTASVLTSAKTIGEMEMSSSDDDDENNVPEIARLDTSRSRMSVGNISMDGMLMQHPSLRNLISEVGTESEEEDGEKLPKINDDEDD